MSKFFSELSCLGGIWAGPKRGPTETYRKNTKISKLILVNYLVQEESDLDLSEVQQKHAEKHENFEVFLTNSFSSGGIWAVPKRDPAETYRKKRKFSKVFFSELSCSGGIWAGHKRGPAET
jgi:hypothetical protein